MIGLNEKEKGKRQKAQVKSGKLRRNRFHYVATGCVVTALGLGSRRYAELLPAFIAQYAGDTLWALMVFVVVGFLAPRWPSHRVALVALLVSYADEISQRYHAPWIDAVRDTWIGGVVLGYGFLWSDIVCYTVGVALGVVFEIQPFRLASRLTGQGGDR